mgnify:CR=1 FL=1
MSGLCECDCGMPTKIASQTIRSLGHMKGQPVRFVAGHNARLQPKIMATCHPEKQQKAKGLCGSCYQAKIMERRVPVTCGHTERSNFSGGLCVSCWRKTPSAWKRFARCHPDRPHQAKGLCLECYNKSQSERHQKWERVRWNFGLTKEQYEAILARQGGVCAICQRPETKTWRGGKKVKHLSVDHRHGSTLVRGLLCHKCNLGIGHLDDDPARLSRALRYLLGRLWTPVVPTAKIRPQRKAG